jgi:hypothetical protein
MGGRVEHANYDVHPDGQRFVVVTDEVQSRVIVALGLIDPEG